VTAISERLTGILVRQPTSIRDGVLDYIRESSADYCGNFGDQWNRFREVQIDSISGTSESHERFFSETGFDPSWLEGKLVLDAGCGAGRFAEVAAECGAFVVAVDLSAAAYACAQTLKRFPPSRYLVVRADLRDLPFRASCFDAIYSLGVLHHTPDPLGTIKEVSRFLAPGGVLATWIYEKRNPDLSWMLPRTWLRNVTRGWPLARVFALSRATTSIFFPVGWVLSWFGRPGEHMCRFLPYAARHQQRRGSLRRQWDYSLLDTVDWYGPAYDLPQTESDVMKTMGEAGLVGIKRLPARGMAIVAEAPKS
jgi:SAM-dependent methyltransferase